MFKNFDDFKIDGEEMDSTLGQCRRKKDGTPDNTETADDKGTDNEKPAAPGISDGGWQLCDHQGVAFKKMGASHQRG